jgi:arylsulfatase A-like enzyme
MMKKIPMIRSLSLVVFLMICSCAKKQKSLENFSSKKQKPNIVFIITDDHAYQALSAYDDHLIQTPNIDRLAKEGMLFKKAFVSNSICSPSRAVTLTGKLSHLNSVRDNLDVFDTTLVTFPKLLQTAGYETAIYGKWHLKSEPKGFDHWEVLPDQGHYYDPEFLTENGEIKEDGYVTDVITDKAINYLIEQRDKSKPFMLMYNHKAPHRQWWPSMEDLRAFKNQKIPVPETFFDDYKTRSRASEEAEMRIADHMALSADNKIHPEVLKKLNYPEFLDWYEGAYLERLARLSLEEQKAWQEVYGPINESFEANAPRGKALALWKYQRYMEDYLAVISSVDRNIGRLLEELDQQGLTDNTLVIYTSDQGFYLGEHGWFDKRFMYEESFRTPLLVRYPGVIEAGSTDEHLVQNIDFAPTVLEVAGVEIPKDMQGRSLVPLFNTKPDKWRDALYYHYYEYPGIHMVKRHYGVRTERYKLIRFYYDIEAWELYDLEADPQELNNVYNDPDYAEVQQKMHTRLQEIRHQYQDASDSLNRDWINKDLARLKSLGWL